MASGMAGRRTGWALAAVLVVIFAATTPCHAERVVVIHAGDSLSDEDQQIQQIAEFYGFKTDSVEVDSPAAAGNAIARLEHHDTLGVLISYDALRLLDRTRVLAALRRPGKTGAPVLVFGISADQNPTELKRWSAGRVRSCVPSVKSFQPEVLKVEDIPAQSRTIAGVRLPAVAAPACIMQLEPSTETETLLVAEGSGSSSAVLVRVRFEGSEISFIPRMHLFNSEWIGKPAAFLQAFSSMAPFLMFLKDAVGDYGWHLDGHYANLTIDDPWLVEPYGHLRYGALLKEMEEHNFHTTIAFIPWNFDRSRDEVVELIRSHPERYSISVHGNNHTHQEFGDYGRSSLQEQTANIEQAVARMDRFHESTGIPYDRFMIFPHAVAPEATFAALKSFDFMGTANSLNVPSGSSRPSDPTFLLRPFTLDYGNLLSLFRYSAEGYIPRTEIAVQAFLDNPVLFYGHEKLFDDGITRFNEVADLVNQIQPDTQWKSLGDISRHLYLVRRNDEGGFDVRMFSNEMALRNPTQADTVFHVALSGDSSQATPNLTVDESPVKFTRSGKALTFDVTVPAGQSKRISVRYRGDTVVTSELGRTSLYASALRRVSDFRDLYLSRLSLGRSLTEAYYRNRWDSWELRAEMIWKSVAAALIIALVAIWSFHRWNTARRA